MAGGFRVWGLGFRAQLTQAYPARTTHSDSQQQSKSFSPCSRQEDAEAVVVMVVGVSMSALGVFCSYKAQEDIEILF